ncbi:MAG: adenosylcobinamide-GDP ribazoletransferase, partial [Bacillota bacterium]|nr:adenosylcobinamide-GDP ribazoletransferase [Bacillota bacterium]
MNFLIAIQFLTRIPIPNIEFTEKHNFINSVKYYPLVGFAIGMILIALMNLLSFTLPSLVIAVVILVANIMLTGGLHLDGFMDTIDGVMAARDKERTLEIMKDSRVGAHSVWAVICLLLLKFALIATLPNHIMWIALLTMAVISRLNVLFSMVYWPYARAEGLGKLFLS